MNMILRTLARAALLTLLLASPALAGTEPVPEAPVKGKVTMVDLGAHKCIPCKMMAPIVEELKKDYEGRAAIVFIDVWENPAEAGKFGVKTIPTQIFYDAAGVERQRHVGFLDKESIVKILVELGVK